MPPSAMTGMLPSRALAQYINGGYLRHTDSGDYAGRADRARPDADLYGICSGFAKRDRCLARGDVAGHDVDFRVVLLDPLRDIENALCVAVRGVHDHHVNLVIREDRDALFVAWGQLPRRRAGGIERRG